MKIFLTLANVVNGCLDPYGHAKQLKRKMVSLGLTQYLLMKEIEGSHYWMVSSRDAVTNTAAGACVVEALTRRQALSTAKSLGLVKGNDSFVSRMSPIEMKKNDLMLDVFYSATELRARGYESGIDDNTYERGKL